MVQDVIEKIKYLIKNEFIEFKNIILEIDPNIKDVDMISRMIKITYPNNKIVTIDRTTFSVGIDLNKKLVIKEFDEFIAEKLEKLSNNKLEKLWFEIT